MEPEEAIIEVHFSVAEPAIGADEDESVGGEVGMEAEVVDGFFEGDEGFGVFGVEGGDSGDAAFAGGSVSVVFEEEVGGGVGFWDEGNGELGFEVGEGFGGVEGWGGFWGALEGAWGPRFLGGFCAGGGADEGEGDVFFVVMEIGSVEGGGGREGGGGESGGEVVAAEGVEPGFAGAWSASGGEKVAPRDGAFDGPALVGIGPIVEGSADFGGGFEVKGLFFCEAWVAAGASGGEEHIEFAVGGIDFELVVAGFVVGGFEEEFEDVVEPDGAVLFGDGCEDVGIVHFCGEVEVIAVPEEAGDGFCGRLFSVAFEPVGAERGDGGGVFPCGIIEGSVDDWGLVGPAAFGDGGWLLGGGGSGVGDAVADKKTEEGQSMGEKARFHGDGGGDAGFTGSGSGRVESCDGAKPEPPRE